MISVVIPVRNDAANLARTLERLADASLEVVVVDGGSTDCSAAFADRCGVRVIHSSGGRGRQLEAGCRAARGDWLWLLHADSGPEPGHLETLAGLDAPGWGRFDVRFDDPGLRYRVLAWFMNRRSRITGICTGDQGIFVHRSLLTATGGVPVQPLMEDVEMSRRLKRLGSPRCLGPPLTTSARRWQARGFWRTVVAMWGFRLAYFAGVSAETLAARYYR